MDSKNFSAFAHLLPTKSDEESANFKSFAHLLSEKKTEGEPGALKATGYMASSALGQFIGETEAAAGTFLQAPAANTLAGVKGIPALVDRGLTTLINSVSPGEAQLHADTQEEAQRASRFAAESRDENVASKYNYGAKLGKLAQDDGRELVRKIEADDAVTNPELIRQQQAMSSAEGLIDQAKAMAQNPLAVGHSLVKSLPAMLIGLGLGRAAAERVMVSGAGAAEAAAARVAAAGGDIAAQEGAAQVAVQLVQNQAIKAASTTGMLSEAGSVALSSRESSYSQVVNTPFEKLEQSPRYREIKAQGNNPIQAREILANEVADQTPLLAGALTAAGTLVTNKIYGGDATAKVLAGVEKPTLKAAIKDANQEAVEEVVQGVPQGYSDHAAMQSADPNKEFDLGGELVQNYAGGLIMGGGGHGGAYAYQKAKESAGSAASFVSSKVQERAQDQVLEQSESSVPKPTEAEAALMKPQNISALDRVGEIDAELSSAMKQAEQFGAELDSMKRRAEAITIENGYGPTFDQEREELSQQVEQLHAERNSILQQAEQLHTERNQLTQSWPKVTPGTPTSFTNEEGVRFDAQYALMEAGDLQTSHDENLRANPAYPPELQPRDRSRAASEVQISGIVQKLDPARLGLSADAATGAPIVGADGLVESGNARTIALKRSYQANGQKAEDYKTFLQDNAAQFGLDPANIMGMQKPVLVRVRATPVNRAEFARQANASTVARMSSVEQARSDSARMDVMDDLNPDDNGDFTTSRDFIRRFMAKVPQTEVGEMVDGDGKLSPAGYARMRNAILAKAYGDSPVLLRMTESLDDNMRNVSKALMQVAPQVAKIRASIHEGHLHDADITPDLLGAVEELSRIKDKGKTVKEYLAQAGMFGDKLTPEGNEMLQFLDENIRRPRQMAEFILRYTEALEAMGNPGQADIFGDNTAPTKGELLTAAKREQNAIQEPVVGEGRNQASEVPAGPDNSQRDNARSNETRDQGNDPSARGQADELIGEKINKDWTAFHPDSGTLNIPRADMPQIKAEHRGAMVNFLKARDISSEQETVPADSLKPTQAEFAPGKVEKAKEYKGGDRSILVSSDSHVLDGHHQWLAKKELGEDVKVIRLDAPIEKLLDAVKEFPSAETAEGVKDELKTATESGSTKENETDEDIALLSRKKITETPEFEQWFGESKVVDSNGNPLIVYHGTEADFSEFKKEYQGNNTQFGGGFFFTSKPDVASNFGKTVMPVYLKAEIGIKEKRAAKANGEDIQVDHIHTEKDGRDIWIVFDPQQIKSATGNNGQFDVSNPDIRYKSGGMQNSSLFGMPVDDVKSHVDALAITWKNKPPINAVQSASDLPFAAPYDARGAFYQGKVWLVADNLYSEADVQMVLFHETLGHAGLRGALGDNMAPALRDIAARNQLVAKAAANWRNKNSDIRGSRSEDKWHTVSIEEALAEMTESGNQITGLQKFISKVQAALRSVGLESVANWMENATQAEVMALLSQARQHIQKGDSAHVFGHAEAAAFSTPETEEQKLSREEARNVISTDVGKSFRELVRKSGEAFQFAKLKGDKDLQKSLDQTEIKFTVGDAKPGREKVRSSATEQFVITNPVGEHAYVYRFGKDVQLDVSGLKSEKSRGTAVYQAVASWAHANGYIFEGDSAGISEAGIMRRTENMISTILRHGESYHVKPHPDQAKALNIRWSTGDSDFNLGELLIASYNQIKGNLPEIDHVTPTEFGDFISKTGTSDEGTLFAGDDFGRIKGDYVRAELRRAGGEEAKTRPVGERTIKRAAITGALYAGAIRRYESGLHGGVLGRGNRPTDSGIGPDVVYKALYSRAIDPAKTAAERAEDIIQTSAKTVAPIDKLIKGATQLLQIDRATTALYNGAAFILDRYTPETIKAGFVSDYGVPEAVIDRRAGLSGHMNVQTRKAGKLIDKLATLTREESRVAYEWMNNSSPQALKHFEDQLPKESVEVLAEVKKMIEALSKEAVALGQLSQDSYDKNSMEYLRRSYKKYTIELKGDKGALNQRARAISILGDQYKGRGLSESAPMKKIQNIAPEWWNRKLKAGAADTQLKGESFIRLERRAPSGEGTAALDGMEGKQKGRLQEVIYYPAGETIPSQYAEWDHAGTYEVRDTKGGDVVLWRDFTKQEREKMGEIDEARFAIAKTLHGMIHDVEVGRYTEWIGKKYGLTHATQVPGGLVDAHELQEKNKPGVSLRVYKKGEWVQVPDTKIQGTDAYKYGKLAGKFIPGPIWNDLRQINGGSLKPVGDVYAAVLKAWKMSKTALSPAVHMNNVMANMVMADWHDVSAGHVAKSLRILMASSDREGTGIIGTANNIAARGGIADKEAAKEILGRYQDSGGSIGTFASAELQRDQVQPLLDALEAEMAKDPNSAAAQVGVMNALQLLRHGEMSAAFNAAKGSKPVKSVVNEGKNLIDLYQSEDEVFRLAAWLKAKEDGATDMQAGHVSRKSFLDYSINAPWVAAMRSTGWPFIAFSYRAIPMLAETVAKRPWKVMKLGMMVGLLNALGYAMSGGDEDDERKYLPEEKAGKVFGLVPKLVRMLWDSDGNPVFLDIRRFIPVGDIFDVGSNNAAIPILPSMMPGGPAMSLVELLINKSSFTGKSITLETDTNMEKWTKSADYLYKAMMPNIAILPGTYGFENLMNASKGKTDTFGRDLSTGQALLNTVGIKVGTYPKDVLELNAGMKLTAELSEIDKVISGLAREESKKGMTYEEFEKKVKYQTDKKEKIIDAYQAK